MNSDLYLMDQDLDADDSASNPVFDLVNEQLFESLISPTLSPQSGMQKIRNVILPFGLDIGMDFNLDVEGDEIAYKFDDTYLYVIYAPDGNGYYEFHAELTDEDGVNELLNDGDYEDGSNTEPM
jgi:hypothetical protein